MTVKGGTNGNGAATEAESFAFTAANRKQAGAFVARYPRGRGASAVMALLDLAQRQHGWLSPAAIRHVADYLAMPHVRALEVATFYSMYNLEPKGRHQVRVCTTTPCWLRGSDDIVAACRKALGIDIGETTADGEFSLGEVECLGACVNAPVLQIGDDYFEDVDGDTTRAILETLKAGGSPKAGSQSGRQTSCPAGGATTLKHLSEGA